MRIVIVEDEKRAARGLRNLLTAISEDAEIVAEASDGIEAFEQIRRLKPDVVFTDIRMEYMDGIALIKAVRENGFDVKFVIISAYEEFEYARQALHLGVVDYLVKPVTEEEVRGVWKQLCADRQPAGKKGSRVHGLLREQYPQAHPLVQKAMDIIESSYATRISQKELAENLGITAEYFSYLFSKDAKESFSRFLRRYRINKAKELLDAGETSAEQVAYQTGFSDVKYFYKCFKEETGVNPGEYRKSI